MTDAFNVYPFVTRYMATPSSSVMKKFEDSSVKIEDVLEYRVSWPVRCFNILQLLAYEFEEKETQGDQGGDRKQKKRVKVAVSNREFYDNLQKDDNFEVYTVARIAEEGYKMRVDYYIVLEDYINPDVKFKFLIWGFSYHEHGKGDIIGALHYDTTYTDHPSKEYVDDTLSRYWTVKSKDNGVEATYLLRPKPDIEPYVVNQLCLMKELFLANKGDAELGIEFSNKIERVELCRIVNEYLASVLEEWLKKPTLKNWSRIMSRINWDY